MKFSLEALSYRGVTTRHLRAVLRNEGKDLLIENLSLGFAGDTTFTTRGRLNPARFGVADAETEAPEAFFVADASFNAGDLPALLASLTGEARAGGGGDEPRQRARGWCASIARRMAKFRHKCGRLICRWRGVGRLPT